MNKATRPLQLWLTLLSCTMLTLTLWPTWSQAQTPTGSADGCEAPARCASPADINAAADVLCRVARAAELSCDERVAKYRTDAAQERARADRTEGQLVRADEEIAELKADVAPAPPWWVEVGLRVGEVGGAATVAACVASDCPDTLVWSAAVVAVGSALVDVAVRVGW